MRWALRERKILQFPLKYEYNANKCAVGTGNQLRKSYEQPDNHVQLSSTLSCSSRTQV